MNLHEPVPRSAELESIRETVGYGISGASRRLAALGTLRMRAPDSRWLIPLGGVFLVVAAIAASVQAWPLSVLSATVGLVLVTAEGFRAAGLNRVGLALLVAPLATCLVLGVFYRGQWWLVPALPFAYPSEALKEALGRTLGVPVFQEQVMQISMIAAGFTPGEADGLRRAMAAWKRKGGLDRYYSKLVDGMTSRGYTSEFAESIYKQIHGFSEYGFPESHAASFALLVYASCWIKRHHPAEFLAAMLNSQPLGFYSPSQLVQDAKRHDVEVRAVDVMLSDVD